MSDEAIQVDGPYDNVFEALGLPESDVRLAKNLARRALRDAIEAQGLSQREAAKLMDVPQPNLARALTGTSSSLSWDQIFKLWTLLGGQVQISLVPGAGGTAGHVEAEGPGMLLAERLVPPAARPAPDPKKERAAAERTRSAVARKK
ncbi:MAG: Helix-turn-helix domain protein [Cyanobacteria bacterium RYN_339]|nr:Helix-turn-helix domain protein [Cyanobacteria bacterium RYN_339]